MRVLICSPLRQKPHIFREYLEGLDNLIVPYGVEVDRFFVVNDCEECIPLLKEGEYIVQNTLDNYEVTDKTHIWSHKNLRKMELLRNMCLERAFVGGYDYCWFIDTDLVVNPHTLEYLLSAQKDIIAEIFWTKGENGGYWPNCWMFDQCGYREADVWQWRQEGVYRVGGTGACLLISTNVISRGVNYKGFRNIANAMCGEDRWFCLRAEASGTPIYIDTHCPATHLYTESVYEQWMKQKSTAKAD